MEARKEPDFSSRVSPHPTTRFVLRPKSDRPQVSDHERWKYWEESNKPRSAPNEQNTSSPKLTQTNPANLQRAALESDDAKSESHDNEKEDYFEPEVPPRGDTGNVLSPKVSVDDNFRSGRSAPNVTAARMTGEAHKRMRAENKAAYERSNPPPPPQPTQQTGAKPPTGRNNGNIPLPPESVSGQTVRSDSTGAPSQRGGTWKGDFRESTNTGFAWGAPRTTGWKGVREGREKGMGLPQEKGVGHTGKAPASVPQGMVEAMGRQIAEARASTKAGMAENVRTTEPAKMLHGLPPVHAPMDTRREEERVTMWDSRDGGVNERPRSANLFGQLLAEKTARVGREAEIGRKAQRDKARPRSTPGGPPKTQQLQASSRSSPTPRGLAYNTPTTMPEIAKIPMTVEEMRTQLTHYEAYRISPAAPENKNNTSSAEAGGSASKKPTWVCAMHALRRKSQIDILESIRALGADSETTFQKLKGLGLNQYTQVQQLLKSKFRQERDARFEWEIVQLKKAFVTDENGKKRTRDITVYLQRSPKPEVNIVGIIQERRQALMQAQKKQQNRPPGPSHIPTFTTV